MRSLFLPIVTAALLLSVAAFAQTEPAGHDDEHAPGAEHAGEGAAHPLGHVDIAGRTLAVTSHGEVHPGTEAVFSIVVERGPAAAELRSWIGTRSGRGSVKGLLRADDDGTFHGHLEVPDPLPSDSAVWLELVTDAGRERGHVALPDDDDAHSADAGTGHDRHGQDERP